MLYYNKVGEHQKLQRMVLLLQNILNLKTHVKILEHNLSKQLQVKQMMLLVMEQLQQLSSQNHFSLKDAKLLLLE